LYGTYVYTGFRPAFVLFKSDIVANVGSFSDEWFAFSEETTPIGSSGKGYINGTALSNDSDQPNSLFARIMITSNGFYLQYPEDVEATLLWVAVAAEAERHSRTHLPGWSDSPTSG
jgi:hypothetical protein